jgi:hypothetical protein
VKGTPMFQTARQSSTLSHLLSGIGHYPGGIRGRAAIAMAAVRNRTLKGKPETG